MKTFLMAVMMFFAVSTVFGQRIRVQEPNQIGESKKVDFLNGEKINLLIYDARILPKNAIINYTSAEIIDNLFTYLENTFESVEFVKLDDTYIYNKPTSNEIYLKVKITAFHAAFGGTQVTGGFIGTNGFVGMSGQWNALVSYSVVLIDARNVATSYKVEIDEVSSGSVMTTVGITTTNLMTKAYAKSAQSLVNFIESSLSDW